MNANGRDERESNRDEDNSDVDWDGMDVDEDAEDKADDAVMEEGVGGGDKSGDIDAESNNDENADEAECQDIEEALKERQELMAAEKKKISQKQQAEPTTAAGRLEYILAQSDVFAHFLAGELGYNIVYYFVAMDIYVSIQSAGRFSA
jgi:hypothetical protein